mmetsp:Transcript_28205/g.47933  ORF Transcript_28205/g.47933 Transcript_28205/m.47933 type:complete len:290 (+) Transcript_28205:122-991(+)
MKVVNATLVLSLIANASAFSPQPAAAMALRSMSSLAAATTSKENDKTIHSDSEFVWHARQDCWRPDVRDVEKISWGMPAKKKRTGSRGVPHRLNEEERRQFDQARRKGFLEVTGSSWRSQRRDAPLLNSYRSLMDARGRPVIVLHKLSPNASGGVDNGDRLVVDLSPLRLPDEFEKLERELKDRILAEFDVESVTDESDEVDTVEMDDDTESLLDNNTDDDGENDWETRPIYQLSPYSFSWEVSRQQGKQIGKFLGLVFNNIEEKATKSKKPKGVKPGKSRRHGGYGIG